MAQHGGTRDDEVGAADEFGSIMCDVDFRKWLLCLVWSQGCGPESLNLEIISRYS